MLVLAIEGGDLPAAQGQLFIEPALPAGHVKDARGVEFFDDKLGKSGKSAFVSHGRVRARERERLHLSASE